MLTVSYIGAKQKEKLKRLESLTIAAMTLSDSPVTVEPFRVSRTEEPQAKHLLQIVPTNGAAAGVVTQPSDTGLISYPFDTSIDFSTIHSFMRSCTPSERQTLHIVMMRERFSLRDVIKYGLIKLGYAMPSELFEGAKDAETRAWIEQVRVAVRDVNMRAVIAAGIKVLASLPLPMARAGASFEEMIWHIALPSTSNTSTNRITLTTQSLTLASFANAMHLRIPLADMMDEFTETVPQMYEDIKPDLRPTAAQLTIPHHPSFDILPWPGFRSNICHAIAHGLIDDNELCLDLMNDGIRCWGSTDEDSLHGRGRGAPWDARSWEAAPWFLEKWEMLIDGRNGDMWKNSEWWRAMRN